MPQNIDKSSQILLEQTECYYVQKHFGFNSSSYAHMV